MNYIITYDIEDNKKRKKLSDLLDGYGVRVNYSVYEIETNATKLKKLKKEIIEKELFEPKKDSIRLYHLCKNCIPKSFGLGKNDEIFPPTELFFD